MDQHKDSHSADQLTIKANRATIKELRDAIVENDKLFKNNKKFARQVTSVVSKVMTTCQALTSSPNFKQACALSLALSFAMSFPPTTFNINDH